MKQRKNDELFGSGIEVIEGKKWNWAEFETTQGFPIPDELIRWVIGQEKALEETKLSIDEWIGKLKYLKSKEWWKDFEKPENIKPQPKDWLPAGPFMLLLGDVGTGKSLIGRAMAHYMTQLYEKEGISLYDIVAWENKSIPSEPLISIHPSPKGKELVKVEFKKRSRKSRFKKWGLRIISGLISGLGGIILGTGLYQTINYITGGIPFTTALTLNAPLLMMGGGLVFSGIFILFLSRMLGVVGGGNNKGIGGASSSDAPKLIIDNSSGKAPFVDATGHGSAQLFGSIAWDPYQTGGLGTPEHQRVSAGDVHRANLGILYIDETKNLLPHEAITLLTVLEDGQLPITLRGSFHGSETSAMAVSTEPVPAMCFFIAAGNMDAVRQIHPALMDRIQGYGKVVYMNTDMPNNIENRRKYVQFVCQEIKRFNLLPFRRDAVVAVIDEARKKSGISDKLTCKFRPMISVIKTASILALNGGKKYVERNHVEEAISEHCKSIQRQVLEREVEKEVMYKLIDPKAEPKMGQIYGLSILSDESSNDMCGSVTAVKGSMIKNKSGDKNEICFDVTGINRGGGDSGVATWITDSIEKVRHVIIQKFGVDPAHDYMTHIDFSQEHGVDGPSAGVTMTVLLCSLLMNKKIRQDVAITGDINIAVDGEINITPVGGVYHKIKAAEKWGFKKVLVPTINFKRNVKQEDFKIKVVSCSTLDDYLRELLVENDESV